MAEQRISTKPVGCYCYEGIQNENEGGPGKFNLINFKTHMGRIQKIKIISCD